MYIHSEFLLFDIKYITNKALIQALLAISLTNSIQSSVIYFVMYQLVDVFAVSNGITLVMFSLFRKGIILVVSCSVRKWSATTKNALFVSCDRTGHFPFPQGNSDFVAEVRRTAQNVLSYIFCENITVKIPKTSSLYQEIKRKE